MSYDLYCYRPSSDAPDVTEARAVVELLNADEEAGRTRPASPAVKERIASALMQHNPRLERFQFDFRRIAESANISEDEARTRYQHVELNPPEGDVAIQLTIYDDHVFVTIPYWYSGVDADQVFASLSDYLRIVRRASGYFAYDPQTDMAFDPEKIVLRDHAQYDNVVRQLPGIIAEGALGEQKKPWWKFW